MKVVLVGFVILLLGNLISCLSPEITPGEPTPIPVAHIDKPKSIPSDCPHVPMGGFNDVWRNEQVWPRLGCAVAPAEKVMGTETYLHCMHAIWLSDKEMFVSLPYIGTLPSNDWRFVPDESGLAADSELMMEPLPKMSLEFPATGRYAWLATLPDYDKACDGLARTDETRFTGQMQQFEQGWLLWNGNVCFVLFADGSWKIF